jgi:molybdenum cofactor cytidylyltransferase
MSSKIGAALLAAGQGERFASGNKLLATVDGSAIVARAAATLRASTVDETVAVLGHDDDRVRETLPATETVLNERYHEGQSTSVTRAVAVARERGWDGTVFMLGDMPFVDPESVDAVVETYLDEGETICAPAYEGKRGNPALFDSRHYETLAAVTGDTGGRSLIEAEGTLVAVEDPGVRQDVDCRADLERYGH